MDFLKKMPAYKNMNWVKSSRCGQVYKIHAISRPGMPLKAYEIQSAFKLFIVDLGLLGALTDLKKNHCQRLIMFKQIIYCA
jgi:hypothetical protein